MDKKGARKQSMSFYKTKLQATDFSYTWYPCFSYICIPSPCSSPVSFPPLLRLQLSVDAVEVPGVSENSGCRSLAASLADAEEHRGVMCCPLS